MHDAQDFVDNSSGGNEQVKSIARILVDHQHMNYVDTTHCFNTGRFV